MGPLLHGTVHCHKGACLHATQNFHGHEEQGSHLYVGLPQYERNVRDEHEARTVCAISLTLVQLPRPFERRPVPEGRKFRRWRQPERLSERPEGASCAEGSDRRNFQAAVTGRHFLPLAAFHSFLEKKESRRPWNLIPETETFVHERHVRILYVSPHRLCKKNSSRLSPHRAGISVIIPYEEISVHKTYPVCL